jgi:osmotically-inducible protein OsmY
MAEYNRNREHQSNQDWDRDRSRREGQRSRTSYGDYGGAYSSDYGSAYGAGNDQSRTGNRRSDSEWDRDEYRQGDLWEREQHLRSDRQNMQGGTYGGNRSRYGDEGRHEGYGRRASGDRSGNDRDWWDRSRDEVSSWFGDDEAERRRRMDEQRAGAIHRGKGPKGYRRSEERIREDAYDRLTDDDRVDATNIQVQMEGDDVVLSGSVNSREEKRRAEDLVERVSGVRNVQNRLRVERDESRGSTGHERDRS